jgi:hypothetical protein
LIDKIVPTSWIPPHGEPRTPAVKVFVSYSHAQGDWVWDRLVPCLKAGGAEVLIDRERFTAGRAVVGQMDATQDLAERQLLLLTAEYLSSSACQHEMERALARDPTFANGVIIPVRRDDAPVPPTIKPSLYVDLRDDRKADQWRLLLDQCAPDLGASAPEWLRAREEVRNALDANKSVNLIVSGTVNWRALVQEIAAHPDRGFPLISMDAGDTVARQEFIGTVLARVGSDVEVPRPPRDLAVLSRVLGQRPLTRLGLLRFQAVRSRPHFDQSLHGTLRNLIRDERRLVLLVQSRTPFDEVLPGAEKSSEDFLLPVRLTGKPR